MMAGCVDCRYSRIDHEEDGGFDDGPLLRCHRYPPQVFGFGEQPSQTWPNVTPDDWCGEYRPERPRGGVQVTFQAPPQSHSRLGPHPGPGPLAY
jgi:hypothetical protein